LRAAVFMIEDMANADGQERMHIALERCNISCPTAQEISPEELGLQLWLASPSSLFREHYKQHQPRLVCLKCFPGIVPKPARLPVVLPDPRAIEALTQDLDRWFTAHHLG